MTKNNYKNIDRKFRLPRVWSNRELKKFAHLFSGDIVNVSAWKDIDKDGGRYRDYFVNANSYSITNYKAEAKGVQGLENEIFLDLTQQLPHELEKRFDLVFNHTTLEHIFEVHAAFANLCKMSRDIVIIVVPFLQQMHASYGDYWRFTPLAIQRLFEQNDMTTIHLSFNSESNASVYLFAIASYAPEVWKDKADFQVADGLPHHYPDTVGINALGKIANRYDPQLKKNILPNALKRKLGRLKKAWKRLF